MQICIYKEKSKPADAIFIQSRAKGVNLSNQSIHQQDIFRSESIESYAQIRTKNEQGQRDKQTFEPLFKFHEKKTRKKMKNKKFTLTPYMSS